MITCLSQTFLDLQYFKQVIHKITKQDLSSSKKGKTESIEVFQRFQSKDYNKSDVLKHLHYVFLFAVDFESFDVLQEQTNLRFTSYKAPQGVCGLMSGTLQDFQTVVLQFCTKRSPDFLCLFLNELIDFFEKEDLWQLFEGYAKKRFLDSSAYYLESW